MSKVINFDYDTVKHNLNILNYFIIYLIFIYYAKHSCELYTLTATIRNINWIGTKHTMRIWERE